MRASWTPLGAPAYGSVLVVGDVTILLDCGCDVGFEEACFERIGAVAKDVDLVLVSHHELRHLGALAAAKARYGLRAPIYATLPVTKLGFVTMYEAWAGYRASFGRDAARSKFTLDDVDAAFGKMRPLKFDQPLSLRGKGAGVVITAHRCGHSVGGAYWRVRLGADDIVYCVDAHHADERHVAGAALSTSAETRRPAVFITDCGAVARDVEASKDKATAPASRPAAEDALVTAALEALRRGGHCLVPADCGSRGLELCLALDEAWRSQRLGGAYDLVFVHSMAKNVLDFARSQIEWMCGDAQKAFDGASKRRSGHPLALREVRVVASVEDALRGDAPKCVVAARGELECGAGAALLRAWASDERCCVCLTAPARPRGGAPSAAAALEGGARNLATRRGSRVPLSGAELDAAVAAKRARLEAAQAEADLRRRAEEMARGVLLLEDEDGGAVDLDDDDDDAAGDVGLEGPAGDGRDGGRRVRRRTQRELLESFKANALFARFAQPAHPTFAPLAKKAPSDDYGAPLPEAIKAALVKARSSLLGLETRDGMNFLGEDDPVEEEAPEADGADEAAAAAAAAPRKRGRAVFDAAYDDAPSDDDATTRWDRMPVDLDVRCRVVRVRGLEGLCDGRSLKALLSRVAPRGVLVCPAVASGKDGAAEKLAKFARDRLFPEKAEALVAAPRPGETVDLGPWLGRAPLADAELSWRIVHAHQGAATSLGDGFDVSRVFSAVLVDDDGAKATKLVLDSELLEAADADGAGAAPSKLWLSARDVVLPALKEKLAAEGVKAVFKAGSLVCDGAIVVRKAADDRGNSQLVVDGPLCPEYYAVSRLVQSAFSLV